MRAVRPRRFCLLLALSHACAVAREPPPEPPSEIEVVDQSPLFVGESYPIVVSVRRGSDGTAIDGSTWRENGVRGGINRVGRRNGNRYDLAMRFFVPELGPGQKLAYARLVLPVHGAGRIDSHADLRLVGLAVDRVPPFSAVRPSEHPTTDASVAWRARENWMPPANGNGNGNGKRRCMPFRRYTTNIAPIINEILARPGWGDGDRSLGLVIRDETQPGGMNYLSVEDSSYHNGNCRGDQAAKLELYPTVRSTFIGKELLGRITDTSATVNLHALLPVELYFDLGTQSGHLDRSTTSRAYEAGGEVEPTIAGLEPNQRYYYRLRYRRFGANTFEAGPERTFHTQRARGSTYTFTVQADSHLQGMLRDNRRRGLATYKQTLLNELEAQPDFVVDLGDTFHTQFFAGRDARDFGEAIHRHLDHRRYFDLVGHSASIYLVLGNHEGEQGWRLDGTGENLAVWATNARKLLFANPAPDAFYGGLTREHEFVGQREAVYAFEWGDALFVALDPFWTTKRNPHPQHRSLGKPDPWQWTLGREQYDWLAATLARSQARFKLVFIHHVTGGLEPENPYGRGGVRAAKHAVGGEGSYEWGGEGADGRWEFDTLRPGWGKPVHDLLADHNVAILFHGHDHCFAREELDHIVYQEVPSPSDHTRSIGFCGKARFYEQAVVYRNPGHLRVRVAPTHITVDYVRTVNGADGARSIYTYAVWDCNRNGIVDSEDIERFPDIDHDANGHIDQCEQR